MTSVPLLIFLFAASHAVCDFALQPEAMAVGKCPRNAVDPSQFPRWTYWLSAHGLVHGAGVALVMIAVGAPQLWWLGMLEAVSHIGIDYLKCEERINIAVDQALHYACKLTWVGVAVAVLR
jgi:hypothetical protein